MERLLEHFENLLTEMVSDPGRTLGELPLLSVGERRQLLEEWNRTQVKYADKLVPQIFEEQVELTPEEAAVVYEGQRLTYRELNRRANQVAHYLRELGVGPEVRVGIYAERSLEMVVGLLAVLKAGGAYVPLDPEYPAERLGFMLEDAQIQILLSQTHLQGSLPSGSFLMVVCMDDREAWKAIRECPESNPVAGVSTENLAYVSYTSGSTGKPKGVAVTHGGLSNYVNWAMRAYRIEEGRGTSVHSSLSFDLTVTSLYPALLSGRSVVVLPQTGEMEALAELLQSGSDFSLLKLTPSHLQMLKLLLEQRGKDSPGTRALVIGGEALKYADLEFWKRGSGVPRIVNEYGPTETVVGSVIYEVATEGSGQGEVPIGRPIANTQVYVLDEEENPVPMGVAGELYLGGVGLGRGYLGRPELTAEKFVPHRFSGVGGERLYRTGDRVRWNRAGELEFLGRMDNQVKLRGYRIELGEIEMALQGHPEVEQAVVVMREDQPGMKRLVGYVTGRRESGRGVEISGLRQYLQERVPEYMVPAVVVELEKLPLNANGKIDRRRLPEPEWPGGEQEAVRPRDVTEELLCGIWEEVLRIERVGVGDNFFQMGGHSLLAMQLISRIRKALGVELPVQEIFEAPTVGGMAERIRSKRSQGVGQVVPAIVRVDRERPLPLSYAQQRLWFIDQLEPGSAAYNIPLGLRMVGELNRVALRQSLEEIVRRHEVLRTRFPQREGVAVQEIVEAGEFRVEEVDLREIESREGREEELGRRVEAEAAKPFDLGRGPVVRATLLQLEEQEHVLLLTLHHIASDGWSMGILEREFAALYGAYSKGEKSPLAELKVQYADYAVWQREWLQGEVLERQLGYWRKQLAEVGVLEMPVDGVRGARASQAGGAVRWEWPEELGRKVQQLSREEGVTLFMTLLAGWQVLMWRYSGQSDVAMGTPIAGRRWSETEELIGFFVNTLVMRSQVRGEESFGELLGGVRETTLGGYEHQDVPFEKLVEELQPERDLSRTPLFQVMLVLQNGGGQGEMELGGLKLGGLRGTSGRVKFDLTLTAVEEGERIGGELSYRSELFGKESMERLLEHFENLMREMVTDPRRALRELQLLSLGERRQVLEEWNRTEVKYAEKLVHEEFEEQAERTPDAVAVVYGEQRLTYRELNGRANRLARQLVRRGAGPEVRIGICVQRSPQMLVGLLAILKSGSAYVPLDPSYPAERLDFMVQDSQVQVVLTERRVRKQIEFSVAGAVILVDEKFDEVDEGREAVARVRPERENLAYLIYTSGSSGRPKAVGIRHGSVAALLHWANQEFSKEETAVVLAATSICFDLSVFEIFVPLGRGGRVVLADNVLELGQWSESEQVTLINTVPSVMGELLRAKGVPATVRVVNLAGEALTRALVKQVYEEKNIRRLFNLYGPSEDTTYSTYACLERGNEVDTVPIGRPIANTQVYVLDEEENPVPMGVAGELYLGGAGLGRGYLGRPELTAEKFVPHRFSGVGGERLYRTGDRARWNRGGELEFLGRMDNQVKLRGYRIELGEIEMALQGHPEVEQAVVVMREDQPGMKRLVGYVTGRRESGRGVEISGLRQYLQERVPEYMVPAVVVELEKLPLNANGKIDRRRLPEPEWPGGEQEAVRPRDVTEELLCGIWEEVLRIERVGVGDNFFQKGGHSLLAMQLISRIRKALGVELPVQEIFEAPTVGGMAERIRSKRSQGVGQVVPAIVRVDRERPLPLSYAQQRLWFIDQLEPGSAAYNIPLGLRMVGELKREALRQSLEEIVRRHEVLRTRFPQREGVAVQEIVEPGEFRVEEVDLREIESREGREEELGRRVEAEAAKPFDLGRGPVVRATLLQLEEQEHVLLLTLHHIASDGWSMGIMEREFAALYGAYREGKKSPLAELKVQYADYAVS